MSRGGTILLLDRWVMVCRELGLDASQTLAAFCELPSGAQAAASDDQKRRYAATRGSAG
jgi:hypothetical protein